MRARRRRSQTGRVRHHAQRHRVRGPRRPTGPHTARRPSCRWPSSDRMAGWSTDCWRPATRWCRSSRRRSRRGARPRSAPAPRLIPATPRSSVGTCACAYHRLRPFSPRQHTRAVRAVVRARTDLVTRGSRPPTSSRPPSTPSGRERRAVFADVTARSAWLSCSAPRRRRRPTRSARSGTAPSAPSTGYSGGAPRSCSSGSAPRRPASPTALSPPHARRSCWPSCTSSRALNQAIADLDRAVTARLTEHPDAAIFTSLPRSGQINAAQILAEWGDCRDAYDNAESVAALAGVSPVTKQSGKHRSVGFRWACNKRFRNAIVTFADNSRHASPWAAGVYRGAIDRGHDHPQRTESSPAPGYALHLPLLARSSTLRADQTRRRRPHRSPSEQECAA